jgi:hypothetical protein
MYHAQSVFTVKNAVAFNHLHLYPALLPYTVALKELLYGQAEKLCY